MGAFRVGPHEHDRARGTFFRAAQATQGLDGQNLSLLCKRPAWETACRVQDALQRHRRIA